MSVLFVLLPLSLLMACAALGAFVWATKKGQFDDLDAAAESLVADERPIVCATKKSREK